MKFLKVALDDDVCDLKRWMDFLFGKKVSQRYTTLLRPILILTVQRRYTNIFLDTL